MRTIYSDNLKAFQSALSDGKICVFETDTVVGLGCVVWKNAEKHQTTKSHTPNITGLKRLYSIKGRDFKKPISWLVGQRDALQRFGINQKNCLDCAAEIIKTSWPGACTVVVRANSNVPEEFCGIKPINKCDKKIPTLGLRMPDSADLTNSILEIQSPICATSANVSGRPPVGNISEVSDIVLDNADFVFTKKIYNSVPTSSVHAKASRVIDCTGVQPVNIRE